MKDKIKTYSTVVTAVDLHKDPAKVIRQSRNGPVEILSQDGTRIITSCPRVQSESSALSFQDDLAYCSCSSIGSMTCLYCQNDPKNRQICMLPDNGRIDILEQDYEKEWLVARISELEQRLERLERLEQRLEQIYEKSQDF